jgi:hypothetical protein
MVFSRVSCQCGNWRSQAARPKVFNLSVSISGSKSLCGKKDHLVAAVLRYALCSSVVKQTRSSLEYITARDCYLTNDKTVAISISFPVSG